MSTRSNTAESGSTDVSRARSAERQGIDRAVVIDGDDTLWETQSLYEDAKKAFVDLMVEQNLPGPKVIPLLNRIDSEHLVTFKFARARFPLSLVRTYETLCQKEGRDPQPKVLSEVNKLAEIVFETTPQLYTDSLWAMRALRRHYRLILATKGDWAIQDQRIERLGIRPMFDQVHIWEEKTEHEYSLLLQDLDVPKSRVWSVGNSPRSDINPMLRLGIRAVWVRRPTWGYEQEELLKGTVFEAGSLREVVALITRQDGLT